ncbi:periplasmic protein [Legionella quinlivanii]|uniref:Periplasmic protein n=1 Tax=Legionella quinlivanii TaxID=45073 RepID=A0A0W0XUS1_9GAMM|nr:hypothetical protein [Legionella quinlivanii]KTD48178.1 periplasmic protein [Legionella quinlivanii]MCW8450448.1 hypothetical protein [Legionella quinlivanii]SEF99722.1 hypothetical protein SAMN02746093_01626 [Legionella quinlivanii DSM 21216]STY11373.1 periplasmic protein [Legionella quinlivanii]
MIRLFSVLAGLLIYGYSFAFTCFATVVKDNCWTNYDVTVAIMDATSHQQILAVTVPKGQQWIRQEFTCQPGQAFMYQATFTPTIWEGDEGKVYKALRFWFLPAAPAPDQTAWDVSICYSKDFAEVPLPPQATGACTCNMKAPPPIAPMKQQPAS